MRSLAEILAWKFEGAQGIRTRENEETGDMEIFAWPVSLGLKPTAAQISLWNSEMDARSDAGRKMIDQEFKNNSIFRATIKREASLTGKTVESIKTELAKEA